MKSFAFICLIVIIVFAGSLYLESKKEPYAEGMHFDYSIICENGFVYKRHNRAIFQVLNTDGTPLRCGHKIY